MIIFLAIIACSEEEKFDNNDLDDTASPTVEGTVEDTVEDTGEDASQPFRPSEGYWVYSGGNLIPEGTTCPEIDDNSGVTDPVGFEMRVTDGGFQIISDGETTPVFCALTDTESLEPGGFTCTSSSVPLVFSDIDDGLGNSMDITMELETNSSGIFGSGTAMQTIFTLTMTCIDVDHPWGIFSCSDLQSEYPTPCDIKFNANASLNEVGGIVE